MRMSWPLWVPERAEVIYIGDASNDDSGRAPDAVPTGARFVHCLSDALLKGFRQAAHIPSRRRKMSLIRRTIEKVLWPTPSADPILLELEALQKRVSADPAAHTRRAEWTRMEVRRGLRMWTLFAAALGAASAAMAYGLPGLAPSQDAWFWGWLGVVSAMWLAQFTWHDAIVVMPELARAWAARR